MEELKYAFLFKEHQEHIVQLKTSFRREFIDKVDWTNRMIGISGARGVGKTTILLQRIIEMQLHTREVLFISMDHLLLTDITLLEVADYHVKKGGTHLFIDEIHKSPKWSLELKKIYDLNKSLSIVYTSSSILELAKGKADLSRRVIQYDLNGLSFREFLQIETNTVLEKYNIEQITTEHSVISNKILSKGIKPLKYFNDYLKYGYYPFYKENINGYHYKLVQILQLTLDQDLALGYSIDPMSIYKIKKLIGVVAGSVPYTPNITKLAGAVELSRSTLIQFLQYLATAEILHLLLDHSKIYSLITKPEKIYLQNPNFIYALSTNSNIGNLRETFFINQVSAMNKVNYSPYSDFLVDEKMTFEVGGQSKKFTQITKTENSFIAADDTEFGIGNKIPLWMFGFLY